MAERRGWLLDVYADGRCGLVVWLLDEDGARRRLHQPFPVTFYAAGPFPRLRALWRFLQTRPSTPRLGRTRRRDLFSGDVDVMTITVPNPAHLPRLARQVTGRFPDLVYYDVDIPLSLRYAAATGAYPLARCALEVDDDGRICQIEPLSSRWDIDQPEPPLRLMRLTPNVNPEHAPPDRLLLTMDGQTRELPLTPGRHLLTRLQANLRRADPDLILTRWGDTWLLPHLLDVQAAEGLAFFNLNRDPERQVERRQASSYFTYGQVIHRGQQVHLFGRWHIDRANAMMFGDYGLEGIFEQARVSGLPVQEVARRSPGAGITAMQMHLALHNEIMIPYTKQQSEWFKSARDLIRADRGGLVYQPEPGLHRHVAEIDFVSMYPSIMVCFNISPETMGLASAGAAVVPELGLPIDQSREGLVPETLRPLLGKRIGIKRRLAHLSRRDCRYPALKARSAALKWLLVVCFGYLGYKNARFGRIEAHESVTAYGREALLRAKEAAEAMGYAILHMYVDGLWVRRVDGAPIDDINPLLEAIMRCTGLPIELEGIYRWVAFLPSTRDDRVPVANRYFGIFSDGSIKTRGIAARRRDTAPWITAVQHRMLQLLAAAPPEIPPEAHLPRLFDLLRGELARLRAGQIPSDQLLFAQKLSRPVAEYTTPSPAARAAAQLLAAGKTRAPGQRIQFLYTLGGANVQAWDLPTRAPRTAVDVERYTALLFRAAEQILQPLGICEETLAREVLGRARQLPLPQIPQPAAAGGRPPKRARAAASG